MTKTLVFAKATPNKSDMAVFVLVILSFDIRICFGFRILILGFSGREFTVQVLMKKGSLENIHEIFRERRQHLWPNLLNCRIWEKEFTKEK
jgi:hypothetical protein